MGMQNQYIIGGYGSSDSLFVELFKMEMRKEINLLKDKILELENKLEDPFG